jgi:hypothetical protein
MRRPDFERTERILEAWRDGEKVIDIAHEFGISSARVCRIAKDAGLSRDPGNPAGDIVARPDTTVIKGSIKLHKALWVHHPRIMRQLGAVQP